MNAIRLSTKLRPTQHKRLVLYDTHQNFCSAKTSFMLGTLSEMLKPALEKGGFMNMEIKS